MEHCLFILVGVPKMGTISVMGLLLCVIVYSAGIQEHAGARMFMPRKFDIMSGVKKWKKWRPRINLELIKKIQAMVKGL